MNASESTSKRETSMLSLTNRQIGVTLIEMMVAITIGLVVTLAVSQAYLTGLSTQRSQNDMTRLQESSRFAFYLLGNEIRRAGFRDTFAVGSTAQDFCNGCSIGLALTGNNDPATLAVVGGGTANILSKSDTITLSFYGEDNAAGTAADGAILDCQGTAVRRNVLVSDTLYIARDPGNTASDPLGEPTLFCSSTNTALPIALIPGVESMQFLYGEDLNGDGVVDHYVPINQVTTAPDRVFSVMASLVVRTPNKVSVDNTAKKYSHFGVNYSPLTGGVPIAPATDLGSVFAPTPDGRIRLQFSTTIALRNL